MVSPGALQGGSLQPGPKLTPTVGLSQGETLAGCPSPSTWRPHGLHGQINLRIYRRRVRDGGSARIGFLAARVPQTVIQVPVDRSTGTVGLSTGISATGGVPAHPLGGTRPPRASFAQCRTHPCPVEEVWTSTTSSPPISRSPRRLVAVLSGTAPRPSTMGVTTASPATGTSPKTRGQHPHRCRTRKWPV